MGPSREGTFIGTPLVAGRCGSGGPHGGNGLRSSHIHRINRWRGETSGRSKIRRGEQEFKRGGLARQRKTREKPEAPHVQEKRYAVLLFGGGAPSTPRIRATMRLRARPRLRARAKDRSLDRKLLSLRCDPEQYSTLLWPPAMCNHSCIRQELGCCIGRILARGRGVLGHLHATFWK